MNLSHEDSFRFLRKVSEAATANPFSLERERIDREIISEFLPAVNGKHSEAERIADSAAEVLNHLSRAKSSNIALTDEQKDVLSDSSLFVVFHRFIDEFDAFILKQNDSAGINLELPFAAEIDASLSKFGFRQKSAHYIAVFYQMRRAFFFISHYVGGVSEPVRKLRERLWRSLFTVDLRHYISVLYDKMESYSVLLLGETGVGKGQAAAALGRSAYIPFDLKSKKFDANFLDVFISANISEYPETLVESELFGHKKGSFTGALDNHQGLFGQTHAHGVLFIDEIGELDAPLQVKILRVLQERAFSPVGSHEKKRFSGRLIAATNAQLDEKVECGLFRVDLYHRLASDVILIPPLRERFAGSGSEFKLLVGRILTRLLGEADPVFERKILNILGKIVPNDYQWPGNLREFEQVIRRVLLHGAELDGASLGLERKEFRVKTKVADHFEMSWQKTQWTAEELLARYARSAYESLGSYEKVAQKLQVDWRTVKKWIASPEVDG